MMGTGYALATIRNPWGVGGRLLRENIEARLSDPPPTDPLADPLSIDRLDLFRICALLSSVIYHYFEGKTGLLPDVGVVKYSNPDATRRNVPCIIAHNSRLRCFLIAFRGSFCFNDFVTDVEAGAVSTRGGLMHAGVNVSSTLMLAHLEDLILGYSAAFPDHEFVFTGHSLGGCVAAGITGFLRETRPALPTRAVAFGPPAMFCRKLWEASGEYCTTFVIKGDLIPFLSLHALLKVAAECPFELFSAVAEKCATRIVVGKPMDTPLINFEENPFEEPLPSLEELTTEIENESATRGTTGLFPPGELYAYESDGGTMQRTVSIRKIPGCDYFGSLVKGLSEEMHESLRYEECARGVYASASK
jgi:hypothetical protein